MSNTTNDSDHEKQSAAFKSVAAALGLTTVKLIAAVLTGSLGILAEAMHSGLDLVAAVITYVAIRIANRPADRTHLTVMERSKIYPHYSKPGCWWSPACGLAMRRCIA